LLILLTTLKHILPLNMKNLILLFILAFASFCNNATEIIPTNNETTLVAVTGFNATAGNNQVTLSWTGITDIATYMIHFKAETGVTINDSSISSNSSPYVHTGLTNSTKYCYIIVYSTAPATSEVCATPAAITVPTFTLTSNSATGGFNPGSAIPVEFKYNFNAGQCTGNNNFPNLSWTNTPVGTNSFVLIVEDPTGGNWVHLNLYNIPSTTSSISRIVAVTNVATFPASAGTLGTNDFGSNQWGGPCPPSGTGTHTYYFKIYALNSSSIGAMSKIKRAAFEATYSANILGSSQITGTSSF